ncbi:hypothetical protein SDC9_182123 [bioreactor metagenome]|uniref:Uncharacterized protein n=1 Tax=bioreactor metagenome TaxID=1076179 RepID=A0A645H951_9ZZZZ
MLHVFDMFLQICEACFDRFNIFAAVEVFHQYAPVHLQRAHGRYDHDCIRALAQLRNFDVHELLSTQVSSETSFRDDVISQFQGRFGCQDAVAAMRNVGERSAMHKCRSMVERLDQVRLQSILHQQSQCAFHFQVSDCDWHAIECIADDDIADAVLQIRQRSR